MVGKTKQFNTKYPATLASSIYKRISFILFYLLRIRTYFQKLRGRRGKNWYLRVSKNLYIFFVGISPVRFYVFRILTLTLSRHRKKPLNEKKSSQHFSTSNISVRLIRSFRSFISSYSLVFEKNKNKNNKKERTRLFFVVSFSNFFSSNFSISSSFQLHLNLFVIFSIRSFQVFKYLTVKMKRSLFEPAD